MLDKTFSPSSQAEDIYAAWEKSSLMTRARKAKRSPTPLYAAAQYHGKPSYGEVFHLYAAGYSHSVSPHAGDGTYCGSRGLDHASISTQIVVERQLAQENIDRHNWGARNLSKECGSGRKNQAG